MDLPPVTYLSMDPVSYGVAHSQVVPYVERLAAKGVDITLHSFETHHPDETMRSRLSGAGVRWHPHRFGAGGPAGGFERVSRGALLVRRAHFVHARSDLAAASTLAARPDTWIWDVRAFWREQRIAQGLLRPGSLQERFMRRVERAAARRSAGIVTLGHAALDVLDQRFDGDLCSKSRVVTTCVDLARFTATPLPQLDVHRLLLAGTLNRLYDVPSMVRLLQAAQARRPTELTVLQPEPSPWETLFRSVGATVSSAPPDDMPRQVAAHHVGLSMLRPECGVSSLAAMPTKLGEFLASGRPVVVSAGLGDLDDLVPRYDCGVVVADTSDMGLEQAADDLHRLLDDDGTPGRCRALAEDHFDLDRGVDVLLELYRSVAQSPGGTLRQ